MAGLRPGHPRLLASHTVKTWMPGSSPGMTNFENALACTNERPLRRYRIAGAARPVAAGSRLAVLAVRRAGLYRARLSGAAGVVESLRAPEGPRDLADADADCAGHSRRSDQCR